MKKEMKKRQGRVEFLMAAGGYAMVTLSVLVLPLSGIGNQAAAQMFGYLVGILFWLGILLGTVFYINLSRKMKSVITKRNSKKKQTKKIPSGLRFFHNKYGRAADICLIVGLIGSIAAIVLEKQVPWMQWVFMVVLITAVWMHFLLNGITFEYLFGLTKKIQQKMEGEKEHEKA